MPHPGRCPTTHFWTMAAGGGAERLHKLMLVMDASQDWQARWMLPQQQDLEAEDLSKGHGALAPWLLLRSLAYSDGGCAIPHQ